MDSLHLTRLSNVQRKKLRKEAQLEAELCSLYEDLYKEEPSDVPKNLNLEKNYFRLTKTVDMNTVRPQEVLSKALNHFLAQYQQGAISYTYLLD